METEDLGRVEGSMFQTALSHRGEGIQQDDEHVVSLLLALHHYRDVALAKGIYKTLEKRIVTFLFWMVRSQVAGTSTVEEVYREFRLIKTRLSRISRTFLNMKVR